MVRRQPAKEQLGELGKAWGPRKRNVMVDLLIAEERVGRKRSVSKVAKEADVSVDFVRSLQTVSEHADERTCTFKDRDGDKIRAVLEALEISEDAFLFRAEKYQL